MVQQTFDDICAGRHKLTPESVLANPTKAQKATIWKQITGQLAARGDHGMTMDEMSEWLGVAPNRISGRFTELVVQGVIVKTEHRRKTRTGKVAAIYRLTEGS